MAKVSKERVGVELGKTLAGPDPVQALKILNQVHMTELVFGAVPDYTQALYHNNVLVAHAIDWLLHAGGALSIDLFGVTSAWKRNLFLAAAVYHSRGKTAKVKNRDLPLSFILIRDHLKACFTCL